MKSLVLILLLFPYSLRAENSKKPYQVLAYFLEITPNFIQKTISAKEEITLKFSGQAFLPLNGLIIDEMKVNSKAAKLEVLGDKLMVSSTSSKEQNLKLNFVFHGNPSKGLIWGDDFVYSGYFTCFWMICDENPGAKAKFKIELILPQNYKATASGEFISETKESQTQKRQKWEEAKPYSTYIFGFAAGLFNEAYLPTKTKLRLLGVVDSKESLQLKFKDTSKALSFFEEKSGIALPHSTYTQVLVPNSEAQEDNAFATIGNKELDPILTDPQEDWSFVHELSHQWWGNLLTCKTWQQVWLNEGITTFMTAAYKEQRWGKEAYKRELELFKKRWQRAIDAQFDVPLTFSGDFPSLGIQRAIVYSKAALFMDALRSEIGEKSFWLGVRNYTMKYAYQSVETSDFQKSMERASGKNLSEIFKKWAY